MEWLKYSMFLIPFVSWYLMTIGIDKLREERRLRSVCVAVDGKIIDYKTSHENGIALFSPVFEYSYASKTYVNASEVWSAMQPDLQANIKVMVEPENPENAYIVEIQTSSDSHPFFSDCLSV